MMVSLILGLSCAFIFPISRFSLKDTAFRKKHELWWIWTRFSSITYTACMKWLMLALVAILTLLCTYTLIRVKKFELDNKPRLQLIASSLPPGVAPGSAVPIVL